MPAINILLNIRNNPESYQNIIYNGYPLKFRGIDEQVLTEVFINNEYSFLKNLLKCISEPKILDLGAHIGTFAIWAFNINSKSNIWSVEADPKTYQLAKLNCSFFSANGLKWHVKHGAAGLKDREELLLSEIGPSMSHRISKNGTVKVPGISLTTLINEIIHQNEGLDLLKIDIEGSEEDLICENHFILNKVNAMVIELHPNLCNTKRVQSILEIYYKNIKEIGSRQSTKPLLFCRKNF